MGAARRPARFDALRKARRLRAIVPPSLDREGSLQALGGDLLGLPRPVAIEVPRERDRGVSELRLYPLELGSVLEGDPRVGVSERVEVPRPATLADARDSRSLHRSVLDLPRTAVVDEASELVLEDEPVVARLGPPLLEQRPSSRDEVDNARLVVLGHVDELPVRVLLANVQLPFGELDVVPGEAGELSMP